MVEAERANAEVARKIYTIRKKAGLSQRELARRVGTTASVICQLEDADYEGHSLTMLRRIASALNHRVQIHLVEQSPVDRPTAVQTRVLRQRTAKATTRTVRKVSTKAAK
jgi:transcriptional regulator with XRE-family HTH domain